MTYKPNDGGLAFPHPALADKTFRPSCDMGGMSLRDWYAGQALAGIMGPNYEWFTASTETGSRVHEAASFAYSLADAMIAARAAK